MVNTIKMIKIVSKCERGELFDLRRDFPVRRISPARVYAQGLETDGLLRDPLALYRHLRLFNPAACTGCDCRWLHKVSVALRGLYTYIQLGLPSLMA